MRQLLDALLCPRQLLLELLGALLGALLCLCQLLLELLGVLLRLHQLLLLLLDRLRWRLVVAKRGTGRRRWWGRKCGSRHCGGAAQ